MHFPENCNAAGDSSAFIPTGSRYHGCVEQNSQDTRDERASRLITAYGFTVFPVHGIDGSGHCTCGNRDCDRAGKHPATSNGFKDATKDLARYAELVAGRTGLNIGIATGKESGIFVIDIDGPEGEAALADYGLPATLTVTTAKGRHLYFRWPGYEIKTRVRVLPSVDVRGDGGYIVGPGSVHKTGVVYEFYNPLEVIEDAPQKLLDLIARKVPPSAPPVTALGNDNAGDRYIQSAINGEVAALARAQEGGRNDQLNRSAFALSGLLPAGEVREILRPVALNIGLSASEIDKTLDSAARSATPRDIPPLAARDNWSLSPSRAVKPAEPDRTLNIIDPTQLLGKVVPTRRWIVENWLPYSHVTALYGDGGTGKSLLAMMLGTAAALGKPWLGLPLGPVKVLGFFCEDTADELHRRQNDINAAFGCDFSDLGNMRWVSGVGEDNILMEFPEGSTGRLTALYDAIHKAAHEFGAQLVIVDTAADTFGGNENNRGQVRQFINGLNRLALDIDGAVLLCAHPSVAGMKTGDGYGGNTAWSNTVRSRLYLERPATEEGAPDNPDIRVLSRKKANYARTGEDISLIWQDGVFVSQTPAGGFGMVATIEKRNRERQAEDCFLKALADFEMQGRNVSSSIRSGNYAPKKMLHSPHRGGLSRKDLEQAMERLFNAGTIKEETYGRPNNQSRKIVRVMMEDEGRQ